MQTDAPILALNHIDKSFRSRGREPVHVARDINLTVAPAETVALIGESGSGKSSLARIALGLLQPDRGEVLLRGDRIDHQPMSVLRERRVAMQPVFQDSSLAFNPRNTILQILTYASHRHGIAASEMRERAITLLDQVGLRPGADYLARYPHEISGGQRQRLGIARAIGMDPVLIIADEPLSGADVSIRGQVLNLLIDLREQRGIAYLFITHDVTVARAFSHRVAVMRHGEIVEQGLTREVLTNPEHPYTRRLIAANPAVKF